MFVYLTQESLIEHQLSELADRTSNLHTAQQAGTRLFPKYGPA